jgi:hypothetical protein
MPNALKNFHPAYSTIKSIILCDEASANGSNGESLDIIIKNTECLFERIEFTESVTELVPNGVLVVQDRNDIVGRLKKFNVDRIVIAFSDSDKKWYFKISSVSYLNNAASDTEENFVAIYFSNKYYFENQNFSLISSLDIKQPQVYLISDFVEKLKKDYFFEKERYDVEGYNDKTTNYVLYRPLNSLKSRDLVPSDDPMQYLNYLTTYALSDGKNTNSSSNNNSAGLPKNPNFMFWTGLDSSVNFKYFNEDLTKDSSFASMKNDYRKIAIFDGDSVVQKLSDGQFYRKAYNLLTNPAYQYISKNYYYIRKTPKFLDSVPSKYFEQDGTKGNSYSYYATTSLMYQFQDEGQKYNLEIVGLSGSVGVTCAIGGAEQLTYDGNWGFYDDLDSVSQENYLTTFHNDYGTDEPAALLAFGNKNAKKYMPYVDTSEMWQNMFDMTEVHPNQGSNTKDPIPGANTNLQKVCDIRYKSFLNKVDNSQGRLQIARAIELQNFILYSLCCMGKREDCFFAVLQKFEVDTGFTGATAYIQQQDYPIPGKAKKYRYQWNKLTFGISGGSGYTGGGTGNTAYMIENWNLDPYIKSGLTQDNTWAININERGITGPSGLTPGYVPPGYVSDCISSNFTFRPIGVRTNSYGDSGYINHIVRMCKYTEDPVNGFYYFTVENVVDGCC